MNEGSSINGAFVVPFNPRTDFFVCDMFTRHAANANNNGGRFPMTAVLAGGDDFLRAKKKGREVPVYKLIEAPASAKGDDVFMAYWCPFELNRTSYTTLTMLADYMFTATMDGCTFGIGHSGNDGSVIVSHANAEKEDTAASHAPMITAQKASIRSMLGSKSKLFQPKDYRTRGTLNKKADVSAMTFGVRDKNTWKFYAHRFRKSEEGFFVVYDWYETKNLSG